MKTKVKKLLSIFLVFPFAFPALTFAQQPQQEISDSAIPIFFFLHHNADTALGILAVIPFYVDKMSIGAGFNDSSSAGHSFDGLIDDVRFWNTALATSTLDANWKTVLQGNETNLVAYYKLDNAYTDSTANSYNLTAASNPAFSTTVPFNTGSGGGALTTYYYNYGTTTVSKQFIGQYYDSDTELSYLNARYYDSTRGQFLSQDPMHFTLGDQGKVKQLAGYDQQLYLADPQQLNSYSYGRNNPLRYSDPKGNVLPFLAVPATGAILDLVGYGLFANAVVKTTESFYSNIILPLQYSDAFTSEQKTKAPYSFITDATLNFGSGAIPTKEGRILIDLVLSGADYLPASGKSDKKTPDPAQGLYDYIKNQRSSSSLGGELPSYKNNYPSSGSQSLGRSTRGANTVTVSGSNIPRSKDPVSVYKGVPVYCWGKCD